jgi:hypothetical protein
MTLRDVDVDQTALAPSAAGRMTRMRSAARRSIAAVRVIVTARLRRSASTAL